MTRSANVKSHRRQSDERRALTGQRIAEARKAMGFSQSQLAQLVGCESQTISLYERGRLSPGAERLLRIAETCGVEPRWLQPAEGTSEAAEGAAEDAA